MRIVKKAIGHLVLLLFLIVNVRTYAQNYWMQRAGGTTIDEGYSISLDANENTYTTGYFSGTATFGTTSLTATGASDVFVTSTDKNGNFLWAVHGGSAGSCRGLAIKADAAGNSYVTGYFEGTATFGSKTITSAGSQDIFIAKYDNTGTIQWLKDAGGPMADLGNAITIDNSGDVIITGQFAGTAQFGSFSLTSTKNNINVFTAMLDNNGNFLWAKGGTGDKTDRGLGVACDASGNVYVTGQFTDTITFDNAHYTNLYDAIFLVKYSNSGTEQWFTKAGGGTLNIANGIAVDNSSNVYLTGNFTGTLSFFATTTVTLTNKYANRIFVAKYNSSGSLLWDVSDGSDNPVTSNSIAVDASGNAYITGNFECIMNSYADQYGQGTFNTVGYWDIFAAEYEPTAGKWQWSRQLGGKKDNLAYSIATSSTGDLFTAGSFDQDMTVPVNNANFIGYNTASKFCNSTYCSDSYYGNFENFSTKGNYDIFITKPYDLSRQPYDYYDRTGGVCVRPYVGVCINTGCPDTVSFCNNGSIYAVTNTCAQVGPDYTYQWSTGSLAGSALVSKSGWYYVTQTTVDGCFKSKDSIYVVINPLPVTPNISDNVVVNTNATSPKPIHVCERDVILTGGGYGSNTYSWSGDTVASTVSIKVTHSGSYCFNVISKEGCSASTCVMVTIDSALKPIKPELRCIDCTHDSIAFCKGSYFIMFTYDSITNPFGNPALCIPPSAKVSWYAKPSSVIYSHITYCPGSGQNTFTPSDSGWYHITDTITRTNYCDTTVNIAHDSVYVRLYPTPSIGPVTIKGGGSLCPGDSTLLIAYDTTPFTWSSGSTKDSIWGFPGNSYTISSSVTNSYGCTASASAGVSIGTKTNPSVYVTPTSGTICPGDSLELFCSGAGTFQWQGPTGILPYDTSAIYVKTPGNYFCVVSDTNYCNSVLSNTAAINLYATPYLVTSPSPVICPGGSITLTVVSSTGSTIQWGAPLSGSDSAQTITTPGTYTCKITSCGITTNTSVTVTQANPKAAITASGATTFCAGDSIALGANTGMSLYTWNPGALTGDTVYVKSTGTYTLTATDSYGCTAKDSIKISVTPNNIQPPVVSDTVVCPGESVILNASSSGNITWYSAFYGGNILATGTTYTSPVLEQSATYFLDAQYGGCRSEKDSINVNITDCNGVYFPNVFTPNGDGDNDVFKLTIKGAKCFDCKIYNRWGVLIYEWNDANAGWNGVIMQTHMPASDGTYYFIVDYCTYQDTPGQRDGFLTLIR